MRMRQVGERREALICWFAFPLFPARSLARFPLPARPLDRPYAARRDGCRIVKKKIKFWEGRRSVSLLRVEEMTRREEVMRRVRWGGVIVLVLLLILVRAERVPRSYPRRPNERRAAGSER